MGASAVARPKNQEVVSSVVALRGTAEYKEWFKELAEKDGREQSELVAEALRHYAKKIGFKAPPMRVGKPASGA